MHESYIMGAFKNIQTTCTPSRRKTINKNRTDSVTRSATVEWSATVPNVSVVCTDSIPIACKYGRHSV